MLNSQTKPKPTATPSYMTAPSTLAEMKEAPTGLFSRFGNLPQVKNSQVHPLAARQRHHYHKLATLHSIVFDKTFSFFFSFFCFVLFLGRNNFLRNQKYKLEESVKETRPIEVLGPVWTWKCTIKYDQMLGRGSPLHSILIRPRDGFWSFLQVQAF